jgi:peptidoglycan-N-acetylglucosamine deacetylase
LLYSGSFANIWQNYPAAIYWDMTTIIHPAPITLTIDLEDHLDVYAPGGRWLTNTQRILDFCAHQKIRATFFTVGKVAAHPHLLKRIVGDGHELALHSYDHIALTKEDPQTYGVKLSVAKQTFETITGVAVRGFRAPMFSLTPVSYWAVDVLGQLGFTYSSSIIAGRGAVHGFAGAPNEPFKWHNGVVELPVPMLNLGVLALPFLGGVYLRYMPIWLVKTCAYALDKKVMQWTYTHPYDVDSKEGYVRLNDGTPLWMNLLLMHNRKNFLQKIETLLAPCAAPPLGERITAHRLDTYNPT